MPLALTLLAAVAGLAAMLTVGSLTALTTLLPPREATWRAGARLSGVAAAAWAATTLALVVVSAPLPGGAALSDASAGAAIARSAIGGGAPLTVSAGAAGLLATASLVGLRRPLAAAGLLVGAAGAAAPLASMVAGRLTGAALVQPGAAPGALAGDSGKDLAVLAGSAGATTQIAAWLLLLALGASLGGGLAVRLVRAPADDAALARRRGRRLGPWAVAVGAVSFGTGAAAALLSGPPGVAATLPEVTALQGVPPLAAGTVAVTGALPAPLPLTPWRALSQASPDLLWLLVAACAVAAYLLAVRRHRRTTDAGWPGGRTAAWVTGCLLLAWVTSGGLAAYASLLVSAQLIAHAALVVAVAPLLAAGAPVTLLRAAAAPRQDGSAGLRECADALAATRVAAATRHPAVALALAGVVVGALWAGAALPLALGTLVGHELAVAAVLGSGLLLTASASPAPPGPGEPPEPRPPALAGGRRVLIVAGSVALLAATACGVLAASDRLLAAGWFTGLGLGVDALADQRAGALAAGVVVVVGCAGWSALALAVGRRRRR